jgi:type IX secretion system PorP/SprF family membrane protein
MRKSILFILALCACSITFAQQLPQLSSYQLNPYMYNPAFAGVTENTEMNTIIRQQWQGINNAPESRFISMYGPLRNEKMALGGNIFKDVLGAESKSGVSLSYAYHLRLNKDMNLSLGMSGGLMQYQIDNTVHNPFDEGDPVFNVPFLSDVAPNASFGMYFYTEDYYVSVAVPQLLNSKFTVQDQYADFVFINGSLVNHYFISGGYKYELNPEWTIEPSVLVKMTPPAPMQYEIAAKAVYKDLMWGALSYRSSDAVSLFLGYNLNEQFYFAYGHDFVTSDISTVASGSNEFKLGFRFNK